MFRHCFVLGLAFAALVLASIHSPAEAGNKKKKDRALPPPLLQRIYSVADLVVPIDTDKEPPSTLESPLRYLYRTSTGRAKNAGITLENCLKELIQSKVGPATWQENGGRGSMTYFPLGMALVIEQTQDVHEQIQDLLIALRRLFDVEVAVETLLVTLPEPALERIAKEMNLAFLLQTRGEVSEDGVVSVGPASGKETAQAPLTLDDCQLRHLFKLAQQEPAANVMQLPRITLANGQGSTLRVRDYKNFVTDLEVVKEANKIVIRPRTETVSIGVLCAFQPVASADRRSVFLNLDFLMTDLERAVPQLPVVLAHHGSSGEKDMVLPLVVEQPKTHTVKLNRKLTIPDRRTAVLRAGKRFVETRHPLSWIPYLDRFVSHAPEAHTLLVLVTPRILVREEPEQVYSGPAQPRAAQPRTER